MYQNRTRDPLCLCPNYLCEELFAIHTYINTVYKRTLGVSDRYLQGTTVLPVEIVMSTLGIFVHLFESFDIGKWTSFDMDTKFVRFDRKERNNKIQPHFLYRKHILYFTAKRNKDMHCALPGVSTVVLYSYREWKVNEISPSKTFRCPKTSVSQVTFCPFFKN